MVGLIPALYERLARNQDQKHHQVNAEDVRLGRRGPGPVLTLLRTYPSAVGLSFGSYGEGSRTVHTLLDSAATAGAAHSWRSMGARSQSEAYGFLVGRLRRTWGVAAVRAAARLRVSRSCYVGMDWHVARDLRRGDPRAPVDPAAYMAGLDPAVVRRQ